MFVLLSGAAILLFGKDLQQYFQRARILFIRYDGIQAKVGAEMNAVKDKIFTGCILNMVEKHFPLSVIKLKNILISEKKGDL